MSGFWTCLWCRCLCPPFVLHVSDYLQLRLLGCLWDLSINQRVQFSHFHWLRWSRRLFRKGEMALMSPKTPLYRVPVAVFQYPGFRNLHILVLCQAITHCSCVTDLFSDCFSCICHLFCWFKFPSHNPLMFLYPAFLHEFHPFYVFLFPCPIHFLHVLSYQTAMIITAWESRRTWAEGVWEGRSLTFPPPPPYPLPHPPLPPRCVHGHVRAQPSCPIFLTIAPWAQAWSLPPKFPAGRFVHSHLHCQIHFYSSVYPSSIRCETFTRFALIFEMTKKKYGWLRV